MPAKTLTNQRPSSEYARWLRAVCEDPSDVTARLAYADWLEEHNPKNLRAEMVRVQVALERLDGPRLEIGPHSERAALRARERELLAWATAALLPTGWVTAGTLSEIQRAADFLRAQRDPAAPPASEDNDREQDSAEQLVQLVTTVHSVFFRRGFAEAAVMRVGDLVPFVEVRTQKITPPPGLLLFKDEPLTAVTLAGKRSYGSPDQHGWWDWRQSEGVGRPVEADDLPGELWDRLSGAEQYHSGYKWYPSEAAAREALSCACVDYGREWAGLSALEWGPLP